MKNKNYLMIILTAVCISSAVFSFAAPADTQRAVSRALMQNTLQNEEEPYTVLAWFDWEREVTVGDRMMRAPRRPAKKTQVIHTKHKYTQCRGVLVDDGTRVLLPASCVQKRKYRLRQFSLHFANNSTIFLGGENLQVGDEIAQVRVSRSTTKGVPSLSVGPVPGGQGLQEAYSPEMTAHLHSFFLAHNVGPLSRTRPGLTAGRRRLQVGDALVYQGRVVALVKKVVSSYADGLGGVSERAFAVVR